MSIATQCMVVNLQIGIWKGYRLDKELSRSITEQANAAEDAARVNKHLIPKDVLKDVETAASSIRVHFYTKTLPWKDNGDRLLTRKAFMSFIEEHERRVALFQQAVDTFLSDGYLKAKDQAAFRMGEMFDPEDYPIPGALRHRFYAHLDIDPVSTAGDFRVDLDEDQLERIRGDMESAVEQRLSRAMADVWRRLADKVAKVYDRLKDEDTVFRNSTIRNLDEIVDLLPDLNITNDPDLERIRLDIKATLCGYDPKELRDDRLKRSVASDEAKRIMEDMEGFMKAFAGAS